MLLAVKKLYACMLVALGNEDHQRSVVQYVGCIAKRHVLGLSVPLA